jgi:lipoate-protein ligase A
VQIASHNAAARQADLEWVCFAGLSHGELIDAHGGKLLGLAQSRGRWGALISVGLLLAQTPWETLEAIHRGRPCQRSTMHTQASVGLAALAPQMSCERICHAVLDALVPYLQSNPDLQTNYERKCA